MNMNDFSESILIVVVSIHVVELPKEVCFPHFLFHELRSYNFIVECWTFLYLSFFLEFRHFSYILFYAVFIDLFPIDDFLQVFEANPMVASPTDQKLTRSNDNIGNIWQMTSESGSLIFIKID